MKKIKTPKLEFKKFTVLEFKNLKQVNGGRADFYAKPLAANQRLETLSKTTGGSSFSCVTNVIDV